MPHAVLKGSFDLRAWCVAFQALREERPSWLIKIEEVYIERRGNRSLLPVVVVEEGHSQSFYVRLSLEDLGSRLTVRLDPSTDPIKTRGVKRSVAFIAETILRECDHLVLDRDNLGELIRQPA